MAAVKSQSVRISSTSSRSVDLVARPPPTSSATRPTPSWRFSARWVATKTLSSTDSSANTWGFWNVLTRPRAATSSGRRPPMSSPFHNTAPELAGASRAITLRSVVFPEPFGPMMPRTSPGATTNDTFETAMRPLKRLVTARTSSSTPRPPRHERSHDAAGHDEDREDQDGAVEHRAQLATQVDDVRQPGEDQRANDRSGQRALAAEQDHGQDLHRLVDAEIAGIDVARVVAVEAAREGGERAPDGEGQELVAEHVHAERAGEIFVEADGREAAAHPRAEHPDAHEDGDGERDQRHVVPRHRPPHGHPSGSWPPEGRPARHDEAKRAVGDGVPVEHDEPDHLREGQGDHGEVEGLQPELEADGADDDGEEHGAGRRGQRRQPEGQTRVDDEEMGGVGRHAEDGWVEHRELAGEAEDQ